MAPPPKYVITRKLISRFFQKIYPQQPVVINDEQEQLFNCWSIHGIDSQKCKEYEEIFDKAYVSAKNYKSRVDSLRVKEFVMSQLATPQYKTYGKGRYFRQRFGERNDVFKGL